MSLAQWHVGNLFDMQIKLSQLSGQASVLAQAIVTRYRLFSVVACALSVSIQATLIAQSAIIDPVAGSDDAAVKEHLVRASFALFVAICAWMIPCIVFFATSLARLLASDLGALNEKQRAPRLAAVATLKLAIKVRIPHSATCFGIFFDGPWLVADADAFRVGAGEYLPRRCHCWHHCAGRALGKPAAISTCVKWVVVHLALLVACPNRCASG